MVAKSTKATMKRKGRATLKMAAKSRESMGSEGEQFRDEAARASDHVRPDLADDLT